MPLGMARQTQTTTKRQWDTIIQTKDYYRFQGVSGGFRGFQGDLCTELYAQSLYARLYPFKTLGGKGYLESDKYIPLERSEGGISKDIQRGKHRLPLYYSLVTRLLLYSPSYSPLASYQWGKRSFIWQFSPCSGPWDPRFC